MHHATQTNVPEIIVETLKELGIPNVESSITETTTPVQDGCYVGGALCVDLFESLCSRWQAD